MITDGTVARTHAGASTTGIGPGQSGFAFCDGVALFSGLSIQQPSIGEDERLRCRDNGNRPRLQVAVLDMNGVQMNPWTLLAYQWHGQVLRRWQHRHSVAERQWNGRRLEANSNCQMG